MKMKTRPYDKVYDARHNTKKILYIGITSNKKKTTALRIVYPLLSSFISLSSWFFATATNAQVLNLFTNTTTFSPPAEGSTYAIGEAIELSLVFAQVIPATDISVHPRLLIGETENIMNFASGGNTNTLKFKYVVEEGDTDSNGIALKAASLHIPNPSTSKYSSIILQYRSSQSNYNVDGIRPTILEAPSITSTPASSDTYRQDEYIGFSLTFSEAMRVTGTPRLALTVGIVTRQADYSTIVGTEVLEFRYQVAPGDNDRDGLSIAMNALELNGGTITDLASNAATLTHPAISDQPLHKLQAALQLKIRALLEGALQ